MKTNKIKKYNKVDVAREIDELLGMINDFSDSNPTKKQRIEFCEMWLKFSKERLKHLKKVKPVPKDLEQTIEIVTRHINQYKKALKLLKN